MQIKCLIVVIAIVCRPLCADESADSKAITQSLQQSAAPKWAAAINALFVENMAVKVQLTDDGAEADVIWKNYSTHSAHVLKQKSSRYEHVWAANREYCFDITRSLTGPGFALRGLSAKRDPAGTAPQLGMLVPEWTFFGTPLMAILDKSHFHVDSIVRDTNELVQVNLHTTQDFTLNSRPYLYFQNEFRQGTEFTLWLDPSKSWQLTKATSRGPGDGIEWEQIVESEGTGKRIGQVVGRLHGEIEREYSYVTRTIPLSPYNESEFYLPHYGLSESTAGFLMGSRQYILVFCTLFFGAILFRVLAYVLKQRRKRRSEATA